jgi:uncharacterized ion transporter superfamily protein YfcC
MTQATATRPVPDTLLILLAMALVLVALSFVVPAGQFDLAQGNGQPGQIQLDQFRWSEGGPPGTALFSSGGERPGLLNAPYAGFTRGSASGGAVAIIALLLVVGGAFGMIMRTGCVDRGVRSLIARTGDRPMLILPVLFVLFSLGGAIFGMSEETIGFVILLAPIVVRLGFDSLTAVLVTFVATRVGFAASWMNPFNVGVAQGIAEIPVLSGAWLRVILWLVFTLAGLILTLWWARRVYRTPELSPVHASDAAFRNGVGQAHEQGYFSWRDALALIGIALGIAWVIWGVMVHQYYIAEIASQFFTIGLSVALLYVLPGAGRIAAQHHAKAFREGASALLPAVLVVGLANGLVALLGGTQPDQPSVVNSLLYGVGSALTHLPATLSAGLMLITQGAINFFVPSGTGQAALTMPLMAPLGDLIGVSRQVSVLAFQLGDSITNLIIPTSATLMGVLGAARVDYVVWARFIWKFVAMLFAIGLAFVAFAVSIGYQ